MFLPSFLFLFGIVVIGCAGADRIVMVALILFLHLVRAVRCETHKLFKRFAAVTCSCSTAKECIQCEFPSFFFLLVGVFFSCRRIMWCVFCFCCAFR